MLSFTFSSFLFNLLMAHIGLLYLFSVFSCSLIVWEESTLMRLHSILEDLHTAKSSGCEGEVSMCLVCCDLNDRWLYYLLLSSVCYPSVMLWFVTWLLWCFYLLKRRERHWHAPTSIVWPSPIRYHITTTIRVGLCTFYIVTYTSSKKIWPFSTHGPALFCGVSP